MNKRGTILAVDDNALFLEVITKLLDPDYRVITTTHALTASHCVMTHKPDVVLLDFTMPELSGMDILRHLTQKYPGLPIIMLTGTSSAPVIVQAMQAGAFDYVVKEGEFAEMLKIRIASALKLVSMKKDLNKRTQVDLKKYEILGSSPATIKLKSEIAILRGTKATVLITGENGTGKELVARNLHLQENDPSRKFISINCSGIPTTLFESEVFGHVQGSFTGATQNRKGHFLEADGGDIFLDEIGELSIETQAKLLRVLQERVVMPVGSTKEIAIDVRIIAATNRNLLDMVKKGTFRQDLYYRINQISIQTPSLRERPQDIFVLANVFANRQIPGVKFSKEAIEVLEKYQWPGNIRELNNMVERACIFLPTTTRDRIHLEHLNFAQTQVLDLSEVFIPENLIPKNGDDVAPWSHKKIMDWVERVYFQKCMQIFKGENREIINRLGISRSFYFKKKKDLGLIDGSLGEIS
jgi:DNA-binding NtrC family response regulator